jgi:hypothetical protein
MRRPLLAALLLAGLAVTTTLGSAADYPINPALKNAPGYVPLFDPESASVKLGRRTNAPLVSMRFSDGARSMEHLGRMIVHAVHHTSPDSLRRLCITGDEFSGIMWREMPHSRPVTGIKVEDSWMLLQARLHGGVSKLLNEHAGEHLEFVRWERTDTTMLFRNFKLHNGTVLVVRDEQGREQRLTHVRAVAERMGQFKIQSMRD